MARNLRHRPARRDPRRGAARQGVARGTSRSRAPGCGYDARMSKVKAPDRKLRIDRVLMALVVLGGVGFAVYWFAIK
jgi:hypothetical protein